LGIKARKGNIQLQANIDFYKIKFKKKAALKGSLKLFLKSFNY
jgi:hypothetical protein